MDLKLIMSNKLESKYSERVSVIIVNWNGKHWLQRCIESLINQKNVLLEIILVDNGSSDDSVEFVRSNFPSVKLLHSDRNIGFAGGNNLGINESTGYWILMLNNDAWLEQNAVFELLNFVHQECIDIVGTKEVGYDDETPRYSGKWLIDIFGHPIPSEYVGQSNFFYLGGVCLFFKRDLYIKSGGLDSDFFMYFEETDWFWRLKILDAKAMLAPSIVVHHAGQGSSGGLNKLDYNRFLWRNQNCLTMLIKNYTLRNLLWILPLYLLINSAEIMIFVLIGRLGIAKSYFLGWLFNIQNLNKTLKKRGYIQKIRIKSDKEVMRSMYRGSAKLAHLKFWLKNSKIKNVL